MIQQVILKEALSIVGHALSEGRSPLPILSHILLAAEGPGTLRLSATNLDMSIHCWIGGEWDNPLAVAVPGRTFIDLINALQPGPVDLRQADRFNLIVSAGRSRSTLHGMDAADFPPIPDLPESVAAHPLSLSLESAIREVAFAAATDEARPTLKGILLQSDGTNITLAAADGYRLAVRQGLPGARAPFSVILPLQASTEWARVCARMGAKYEDPPDAEIRLSPDNNRIFLQIKSPEDATPPMRVLVVSSLIPGKFPDYEQLIPRHRETGFAIDAPVLRNALKTATVFARESENFPVTIAGTESNVDIMASSWMGDIRIPLYAHLRQSPEKAFEIMFNAQFLLDALSAVDDTVSFDLASLSGGPGVIRPYRGGYIYVVMPMSK